MERERSLREQSRGELATAKAQQEAGDALYWPVFNLDIKNPRSAEALEHLPPEVLADSIVQKTARIAAIMAEVKKIISCDVVQPASLKPAALAEVSTFGDVLEPNRDVVAVDPMTRYQQVTIKLWGRGVVPRGEITGADIKGTARVRVRAGQFIISKIDARNGAMGVVPPELDGALASNDFPAFDVDARRLRPKFLGWLTRTPGFVALCKHASEGTTNRVRLNSERMLALKIHLPEPDEQDRIVATLDGAATRLAEAQRLCREIDEEADALMRSAFHAIADGIPRARMAEVAPLVRRAVDVRMGGEYPELGIRSFGRGTFHKPSLDYMAVGDKKLYRIEPGDLVFNNVFAWEGAIAVAQPEDAGRVGSHRFITCVPRSEQATPEFLCAYFRYARWPEGDWRRVPRRGRSKQDARTRKAHGDSSAGAADRTTAVVQRRPCENRGRST